MINTIVVGTDGSNHGQHAVAWAADLARQLGAEVVLVHVAPPLAPPMAGAGGYVMYVPQDVLDQNHADLEERVVTEFCAPLRAAGVAWQSRVVEGSAPIVLAEVATEVGAQLIVVGTRALHALGELLHGSTSHGLTLHTDVPVVVVPLGAHVPGRFSVAAPV
ncbi:MAG: universal stress protein [Candidatus Dormiibacterota bacterium]